MLSAGNLGILVPCSDFHVFGKYWAHQDNLAERFGKSDNPKNFNCNRKSLLNIWVRVFIFTCYWVNIHYLLIFSVIAQSTQYTHIYSLNIWWKWKQIILNHILIPFCIFTSTKHTLSKEKSKNQIFPFNFSFLFMRHNIFSPFHFPPRLDPIIIDNKFRLCACHWQLLNLKNITTSWN